MAPQKCVEVTSLTDIQVQEWLDSFDTVLTDCDGVLWNGKQSIDGSPDLINRLRKMGKRVFYVTNGWGVTTTDVKERVDELGFGGSVDDIVCASYLVAMHLQDTGFDKAKKVYIVSNVTAFGEELTDAGFQPLPVGPDPGYNGRPELDPDVGAVVIGIDREFSCSKIIKAASYLARPGCAFVAATAEPPTKSRHDPNVVKPGPGTMVAAVSHAASGRLPVVVGKPEKFAFDLVKRRHPPAARVGRTLMIGDRAETDILFGKNCGLQTLLVGTGHTSLETVRQWEIGEEAGSSSCEKDSASRMIPDKYVDSLGDLLHIIDSLQVCGQSDKPAAHH